MNIEIAFLKQIHRNRNRSRFSGNSTWNEVLVWVRKLTLIITMNSRHKTCKFGSKTSCNFHQ